MIARFVQVEPDLLTRLIGDPSLAPGLFKMDGTGAAGGSAHDVEDPIHGNELREDWRRQLPKLLEGSMSRLDPASREALTRGLESLGVSFESGGSIAGTGGLRAIVARRSAPPSQHNQKPLRSHKACSTRQGMGAALSLDKAWHGVHYLLCGEADADSTILSQAVLGGTEFGDDLGYGPARYFAQAKVSLTAHELTRDDLEVQMKARFDPAQMSRAGIYPRLWAATDADWLMEEFRRLRTFYADAGAGQFALVTCIV